LDYTKQLIKAITDLTKSVNRNTEAIKENTNLNQIDINSVESGTPDDLKAWYENKPINSEDYYPTPDLKDDYWTRQNELNKTPLPCSVDYSNVMTTDGLGNSKEYKKGLGGIVYATNENIGKSEVIISTGEKYVNSKTFGTDTIYGL